MNEFRLGEDLWMEWEGDDYESEADVIYYTFSHVDTNIDIVQRALACALQRDGVAISIGDGFKLQTDSRTVFGYVGHRWDEPEPNTFCDNNGETPSGECLDNWVAATFIEINF